MSADMPIAQYVLTPGAQFRSRAQELDLSKIRTAARTHFRFNIQVASELYYRGKQNNYHLENDFGSLRSPYDNCWFEWRWPSTMVIDGKESPSPQITRVAAVVETGDDTKSDNLFLLSQILMQAPGQPVTVMPVSDLIQTTPDGNYIKGSRRWPYPKSVMTEAEADQMGSYLGSEMNVLYLALNLINCRNVTTAKAGTIPVRRSGRAKKKRIPQLDYHTIVLPGMPSPGRRGAAVDDAAMPLHRVRGHFKTFTAEAPLLGQHVGTYWWGWQVRGNKKNGVVVSDYKIGAAS